MKIATTTQDAMSILQKLLDGEYGVSLIPASTIRAFGTLEVWTDSSPSNYEIVLKPDGTWSLIVDISKLED